MMRHDPEKLAEQLSAFLDGELDEMERARIEEVLRSNPAARDKLASIRDTVELVRGLPRRPAPHDLAGAVMGTIERSDLLGDKSDAPIHARPGWRTARSLLLTAALLAVTVTVGLWSMRTTRDHGEPQSLVTGPSAVDGSRETFTEIATEVALPAAPAAKLDADAADSRAEPIKLAKADMPSETDRGFAREREEHQAFDDVAAKIRGAPEPATTDSLASTRTSGAMIIERLATAAPTDESGALEKKERHSQTVIAKTAPPIRLEITCADADDLRWCRTRLTRFLADQREHSRSPTEKAVEELTGVRFENNARVTPLGDMEIHADLTDRQVHRLLGIFDAAPAARREVALSVGDAVSAHGWSQTQQLLAMLPVRQVPSQAARGQPAIEGWPAAQAPGKDHNYRKDAQVAQRRGRGGGAPPPGFREQPSLGAIDTVIPQSTIQPTRRVHIRLTAPKTPTPPPGPPGRLVPDLTKDPQNP